MTSAEPDLFDLIARAAWCALISRKRGRRGREGFVISPTQVANIIMAYEEAFWRHKDHEKAVKVLIAYLSKQVSRGEVDPGTLKWLKQALTRCSKPEEIREALGMFRWRFQAGSGEIRTREGRLSIREVLAKKRRRVRVEALDLKSLLDHIEEALVKGRRP